MPTQAEIAEARIAAMEEEGLREELKKKKPVTNSKS